MTDAAPKLPNLPPPKRPRYTQEQVIAALRKSRGMVSQAARALGCEPLTVRNYIHKHPAIAAALMDEREQTTDIAELALYRAIEAGESWAVRYYLSTQGKARGYVERHELTGKDGAAVVVEQRADLRHLSTDELAQLETLLTKAGARG